MASRYGGYMGKWLDIDLTAGKTREYEVSDEYRRLYLGGKSLAARILYDATPRGVDPLGPENVLIVCTGPLTGSGGPCTSRFNATTKSPLSGTIVSSNCGGDFGIYLKRAGLDGIILRGKAESPVWVHIDEGSVEFRSADELWGLNTEETQEKLPAKAGKIVIGPAGENEVLYSAIISGERVLGRGGVGAVMGSKNLKAVTATGRSKVPIADEEKFKGAIKKWVGLLKKHPVTSEILPSYGTSVYINPCSETNTLPTRNFSSGHFEYANDISGETLAETKLTKNFGCLTCPIKCGRRVMVDEKEVKGPEYETMGLLGSNLGNRDLQKICDWNYIADLMGLDTISLGNTLGFAMELNERGLWGNGLSFGKTEGISDVIEDIAHRRGIGDDLAQGVRKLAEKYGGEEFAIHVKGLEIPSYEPRGAVGHGLGYAVADRGGCHIAGGYVIYFEANGPLTMDPLTTRSKPQFVALMQDILDAISSSGTCQFTSFTALPPALLRLGPTSRVAWVVAKVLEWSGPLIGLVTRHARVLFPFPVPVSAVPHVKILSTLTGMRVTLGDFITFGERSVNMARLYNVREGITVKDDTLPDRLTKEPQAGGTESVVPLKQMLRVYYRVRGWDERGLPKPRTLRNLGIRR